MPCRRRKVETTTCSIRLSVAGIRKGVLEIQWGSGLPSTMSTLTGGMTGLVILRLFLTISFRGLRPDDLARMAAGEPEMVFAGSDLFGPGEPLEAAAALDELAAVFDAFAEEPAGVGELLFEGAALERTGRSVWSACLADCCASLRMLLLPSWPAGFTGAIGAVTGVVAMRLRGGGETVMGEEGVVAMLSESERCV